MKRNILLTMHIFYFLGLFLISLTSQAANSPVYDFNSGLLTLPFVNTQQGAYAAELQIDPNAVNTQPAQFKLTRVSPTSIAMEGNQSPHYDFNTGLLVIPYVTTQQGSYSATLQLASNTPANTASFNLTIVNTYISLRSSKIQTCPIFPADNFWNVPINTLAVHSRSDAWINAIGSSKGLHMDFGSGQYGDFGILYNLVAGSTTSKSSVIFDVASESDPGPYPIPENYLIESGADHHLLMVDTDACQLYELYDASNSNGWQAYSGATWDLNHNQLRQQGWTSADAAGLPIFVGLLRYDEVDSGFIGHAIRFTVPSSNSYVWPARHLAGGNVDVLTNTPPFGARFRLKASYDISKFDPSLQVILKAMQTYGLINADNGSGWFIGGAPDSRWNDDLLQKLGTLKGSDFEAVETSCMMININSAQADPTKCAPAS